MITQIRGGRLVDPSQGIDEVKDLYIEDGKVLKICHKGERFDAKVGSAVDASGKIVAPGFIDLHVHLREPGQTEKEDIESGTASAVAGGFTSVLCMPNTRPSNDRPETTEQILKKAREKGQCKVYPVGALTRGLEGKELSPLSELRSAGCVAFSDDGRPCFDTALLREAMLKARELGVPVIEHCEELSLSGKATIHEGNVARSIGVEGIPISAETVDVARTAVLAAETGARVHLGHLSCADSLKLLRAFRPKVSGLTSEVTPHHLMLTVEEIRKAGTNAKMYPPLRTREDVLACQQALVEGLIDAVATDHAPHTEAEKNRPFEQAPNGVIGLETALPVLLTLVESGRLSLPQLVDRMSTSPARIASLHAGSLRVGMPADLVIFSTEEPRSFANESFRSKSRNTPFREFEGKGRVHSTFVDGRQVFGGVK